MESIYLRTRKVECKNQSFRIGILITFFLSIYLFANAQTINKSLKTPKAVMDSFMDKRFGMFIHWGPVTLRGTELSWSRDNQVPIEEYDNLYREFNPVLFNADAWIKTAKDAGMKYLTIAAKHHDGFCLWPTAYTAHNIMSSPYKKDIIGELAKACKKNGIKFCIYYSVLDWFNTDYPVHSPNEDSAYAGVGWYMSYYAAKKPKNPITPQKGDMDKYVAYMKNQLKELITRYHPYMLWFDGGWEKPWTREYAVDVYQYIKSLDKNVIINNRLGKGETTAFSSESVGDYLTPEQTIGALNMNDPWESCISLGDQWSWKPNDNIKSLKQCVQTLVKTSGGNGNLLLDVGPMMDGRIEERQRIRLKEIGAWLSKYGTAVYGTKGGPFMPNEFYAATRTGNKIFVHVFERKEDVLVLPALVNVNIRRAYWLNGKVASFKQQQQAISIELPATLPDINCSVLVLELDKNAELLPVINNKPE